LATFYGLGLGAVALMRTNLSALGLAGWRKKALAFIIAVLGTLLAVRASILLTDGVFRLYEKVRRWRRRRA